MENKNADAQQNTRIYYVLAKEYGQYYQKAINSCVIESYFAVPAKGEENRW